MWRRYRSRPVWHSPNRNCSTCGKNAKYWTFAKWFYKTYPKPDKPIYHYWWYDGYVRACDEHMLPVKMSDKLVLE